MRIELTQTLALQRQLYSHPRDRSRFDWYIRTMRGDHSGDDNELDVPMVNVNPMGKEHCLAAVEALLAIDAEAVVRAAVGEASSRLRNVAGELRVVLNLIDDVGGGWTNRYFVEAELRLGSETALRSNRNRRWLVVVPTWASEPPAIERLRQETLAAVYRNALWQRDGLSRALAAQLRQEGEAIAFALPPGGRPEASLLAPALDTRALDLARDIVTAHRAATDYPTQVAAFFGDDAALTLGYPALGLPACAGFAVALDAALSHRGATL